MPRFVDSGPFVPDRLVQALEDDRVVVFCGAGISMGAGLPSYAGLVSYCYQELGADLPPNKSPEWLWPDRMLGSLEHRFGADRVREKTAERLNLPPTDLSMHEAILTLSRLKRSDGFRLVTTNFDTFFESAKAGLALGRDFHSGPVLPIPRNDRISSWRSIVYLHGRLEEASIGNQHLVLTSADFGRAYLTEAWAARFVARLFSDFTVLFIGYSLNDPVLRYMTDAFAAEDALSRNGTQRSAAYIFVPFKGTKEPDTGPWRARKLEPIFYNEKYRHTQLKKTLIAWAGARQDYLSNTRIIISRISPINPSSLEPSAAANLLWAVAGRPDDAGHGARIFAAVDPPPPIEWLFEFERRDAQIRKEYEADVEAAREAELNPPVAPQHHISLLFPARTGGLEPAPSRTAWELIPWLVKHLGSSLFTQWIISKLREARRPHEFLRAAIRKRLSEAPALPAGYEIFWRVVSAEGEWANGALGPGLPIIVNAEFPIYRDEPWAIQEFVATFRPWLTFEPSLGTAPPSGVSLADIADPVVFLNNEDALEQCIAVVNTTADADAFWAARLERLTELLRQVLDLYQVVGEAGPKADPSIVQRPSIIPHEQNNHHAPWARLIDLVWRGWTYLDKRDADASRAQIMAWRRIPYLAFRRLVLAAVTNSSHFSAKEKLEVLLHA